MLSSRAPPAPKLTRDRAQDWKHSNRSYFVVQAVSDRFAGLPDSVTRAAGPSGRTLQELAQAYSFNLTCQSAARAVGLSAVGLRRIAQEAGLLVPELLGRLDPPLDPGDLKMACALLAQESAADARLGFEFLDNLLPFRQRSTVLRLLNQEYPLALRARLGLRRFGGSAETLKEYAAGLGFSRAETALIVRETA